MLVRLAYASRATQSIDDALVSAILAQSRDNNLGSGITGVLCACHQDNFLQVLEGGRDAVNRLYARLLLDPRHSDVTILSYDEISARRFSSCRLGLVDIERLNAGVILRYSETQHLDPFRISGGIVLALMDELMGSASIIGGN